MENNMTQRANTLSTKIGLVTGALLLILGLGLVFFKPDANKTIAYFMVVYGAFRLGLAVYANYLRKKPEANPDTEISEE